LVERAVPISQQRLERDHDGRIWVFCPVDERGDLKQAGAHGGGAPVKQHVVAAPEWVGISSIPDAMR
jgi:hypothetical protein